jgi:anti-sigma regulatory factor (Ser/Thr protein kinase)
MPRFRIPPFVTIHQARNFLLSLNHPFDLDEDEAVLELPKKWVFVEPIGLAMISAWGAWCRRAGYRIRVENVENLGRHSEYLARMKLFQHLGTGFDSRYAEHEVAGRFLPITQVTNRTEVTAVIGNISAMLHLEHDTESLAAVQYCISELLRNVLEHSQSPDGAFVAAQRFKDAKPPRITIAVADCGQGIAAHLGRIYPEVATDDKFALGYAMQPGITGAVKGLYGTSENAGAGLFITRCIAKGTGGYFLLASGNAGYRLRRTQETEGTLTLYQDPFDDPRHDLWNLPSRWNGTAISIEINTERIDDYEGFFHWIFKHVPSRKSITRKIQFT